MKMKKHKTKKRVIKKLKFQDYKICKKIKMMQMILKKIENNS